MGEIHRLLSEHGRQKVLQLDFDRTVIDAAVNYMGADDGETGFLYSGFAQAALPHKRLPDDASWQVRTDYTTLIVQPGLRPSAVGAPIPVGVPFGSRARLICIYLQSEAIRTNNREIELGRTMHAWLRRMGISIGGNSMARVREQAERLSRCRLTFQTRKDGRTGLVNQNVLDAALFAEEAEEGRPGHFLERAVLSHLFFEQLRKHPVPIEEAAIAAIANNSPAMDIYCWLAYRLHALDQPINVSWKALQAQLGAGVQSRFFRHNFKKPLELALAVYPDAKVEVGERGLLLHPSKPPVSPKLVSLAPRRKA